VVPVRYDSRGGPVTSAQQSRPTRFQLHRVSPLGPLPRRLSVGALPLSSCSACVRPSSPHMLFLALATRPRAGLAPLTYVNRAAFIGLAGCGEGAVLPPFPRLHDSRLGCALSRRIPKGRVRNHRPRRHRSAVQGILACARRSVTASSRNRRRLVAGPPAPRTGCPPPSSVSIHLMCKLAASRRLLVDFVGMRNPGRGGAGGARRGPRRQRLLVVICGTSGTHNARPRRSR